MEILTEVSTNSRKLGKFLDLNNVLSIVIYIYLFLALYMCLFSGSVLPFLEISDSRLATQLAT